MNSHPDFSFENTENAFAHKSNKELKLAYYLFYSMSFLSLVKLGTKYTPWLLKSGLPVKGLIRKTIFKQFVGGETLEETAPVAKRLSKYNVNIILAYGVEGKQGEDNYDRACEEFIKVINYAASQPNIPFMSLKVTGFCRFGLLEKLDAAAKEKNGYNGMVHTEVLTEDEKAEWERFVNRVDKVCAAGAEKRVGVMIDAEESWIQYPIDALIMQMMEKYNKNAPIVYNTLQLYRHDRLQFLKDSFDRALQKRFFLGEKLVRGAYMEKERRRALEMGYPSPIHADKESCDRDFDAAVSFCIDHIDRVSVIVASHNEASNFLTTALMKQKNIPANHPHVNFSQLYGMSDHISFNLAKAGYNVTKYLPFGPIEDVVPFLMRRAEENSSVAGQTGRELRLIKKEIARRK